MKPFAITDYFKIKQRIAQCDAFYAALYGLVDVSFSNEIDTACINFDREGNALNMKINEDFWKSLNEDAQTFIILHELYHVVYDHGRRIMQLGGDFDIGNIASDIVINHHIHEKMGVYRELFDWQRFCWVETCFKDEENVPTDKSFEFYYNKLSQQKSLPSNKLLGSHQQGSQPQESNTASGQASPSNKKEKEQKDNPNTANKASEHNDVNNPEDFSDDFKEIMRQNPQLADEIAHSPDFQGMGDKIKEHLPIHPKLGSSHEGNKAEFVPTKEKPQFNKLMSLLTPSRREKGEELVDMWVGQHRRYASFLKNNTNIHLPNIKEEEVFTGYNKKDIWIFMDSSGSCRGMFHAFSTIIKTLLKDKRVHCRAFSFGDDCHEVNVNDHKISFFSGNAGGFDCIEQKIQEIMKKEKISYPHNIVLLSDGGVTFKIRDKVMNPKSWILLINNNHCHHLTPKGGKYLKIDDNFFGLDKKSSPKPKF